MAFIRLGSVVPSLGVADICHNIEVIKSQIVLAEEKHTHIVVFPELSITGYTCQDMFLNSLLIDKAKSALCELRDFTADKNIVVLVGAPLENRGRLYNCAVALYRGEILGVVPKTYLPNYNEFYEQRWFSGATECEYDDIILNGESVPFGADLLFRINEQACFGAEICEDLWAVKPPSDDLALAGANIICNLSASNEVVGKCEYRRNLVKQQSAKTLSAYVYASSGVNESTTDLLFGGHSLICENGAILAENQRFDFESNFIYADIDCAFLMTERLTNKTFACEKADKRFREIRVGLEIADYNIERSYKKLPFVPSVEKCKERCEEIINLQSYALCKRMKSAGLQKLVIGVSGGLDSTLALLVCKRAVEILGLPYTNIVAITMQGFGTTSRTYNNAVKLINLIGAEFADISIVKACEQHFADIGLANVGSLAFENAQARERTQILFDKANMENALVVGTGDLSELVLGYCTYNGDHMSSYAVNAGVPKTLVRYLVEAFANMSADDLKAVLLDILDTPISPELLPSEGEQPKQVTEDIVGSYELNDFFIYHFLRRKSDMKTIAQIAMQTFGIEKDAVKQSLRAFIRRFFINQFKRSCLPDSVKIGTVSVSPRGDLRMSSDESARAWLEEIDNL